MMIGHKSFHITDQFKRREENNKVALAVELSIILENIRNRTLENISWFTACSHAKLNTY